MGTSCALGYKKPDDTVITTRVNWDAYPSGVGLNLINYWNDDSKALRLCSTNEIRTLEKDQIENYKDSMESKTLSYLDFKNRCGNEDYGYIWKDNKWHMLLKDANTWVSLEDWFNKQM